MLNFTTNRHKNISAILVPVFLSVAFAGCTAHGGLQRKVDVLEKEIVDLKRENRKLAEKLDELQVSVAARKFCGCKKPSGTSGRDGNTGEGGGKVRKGAESYYLDEQQISQMLAEAEKAFSMGNRESARRKLELLVDKAPDHPAASKGRLLLGRILYGQGEYALALDQLRRISAGTDGRDGAEALLLSARCSERLGRFQDAKNTYLQLVQVYPLSPEAVEANKRLKELR